MQLHYQQAQIFLIFNLCYDHNQALPLAIKPCGRFEAGYELCCMLTGQPLDQGGGRGAMSAAHQTRGASSQVPRLLHCECTR